MWFTSGDGSQSNFARNYRIGKTLGKGTFGEVKVAIHNLTGEKANYD